MMCSLTPEAVCAQIKLLLEDEKKRKELGKRASVKLMPEQTDVMKYFEF